MTARWQVRAMAACILVTAWAALTYLVVKAVLFVQEVVDVLP